MTDTGKNTATEATRLSNKSSVFYSILPFVPISSWKSSSRSWKMTTMCRTCGITGSRNNSINAQGARLFSARTSFLYSFRVRGRSQQVISRNIVEPTQGHQMPDRHFVCAPLVAGVHGLGRAQHLRDLGLRQVIVFPQATESVQICAHTDPPLILVCPQFSIVNIFTIDFSKYVYYNDMYESLLLNTYTFVAKCYSA